MPRGSERECIELKSIFMISTEPRDCKVHRALSVTPYSMLCNSASGPETGVPRRNSDGCSIGKASKSAIQPDEGRPEVRF